MGRGVWVLGACGAVLGAGVVCVEVCVEVKKDERPKCYGCCMESVYTQLCGFAGGGKGGLISLMTLRLCFEEVLGKDRRLHCGAGGRVRVARGRRQPGAGGDVVALQDVGGRRRCGLDLSGGGLTDADLVLVAGMLLSSPL